MEVELTDHLGCEHGERRRVALADARDGRAFVGFDETSIALYARGMAIRDIQAHGVAGRAGPHQPLSRANKNPHWWPVNAPRL